MITATSWVPRGYAAQTPKKYEFDEEEFNRISKLAQQQLDAAQEDLEVAKRSKSDNGEYEDDGIAVSDSNGLIKIDDDDLREYDLEHYDDEPEIEDKEDSKDAVGLFGNIRSLVYHDNDEDDPYVTKTARKDEDEEQEELQILATDNLLLVGRVEDELAHLEVCVFEDGEDNLYVHHDILLPAIPLAIEWLNFPLSKDTAQPSARGNTAAVGTMDPDIELWDLDMVDCMYPNVVLGQGGDTSTSPKRKKKRPKTAHDDYHVDAVLSISSNQQHRNLLASGSADKTIKLWDLNTKKCAKSYTYHGDKVCSIVWHPTESTALLSGGYDRRVVAADMRAPDGGNRIWTVESDVETVRWNPHDPNYFYVSTEAGNMHYFDGRITPSASTVSASLWRLQAHDAALTAFDVNEYVPGFIATASVDKQVKLWNVKANAPSMVVSRDLGVGKVFSAKFAPDAEVGFRLAVAGSKGNAQIWDTSTNAAVRRAFAERVPAPSTDTVQERMVSLQVDSGSESEEGWEDDDGQADGGARTG